MKILKNKLLIFTINEYLLNKLNINPQNYIILKIK